MDGIKLQMAFCVLLISFWTFSSAQLVSEAKAQQTPAHSLLSTEEHIKSIIPDKLKDLERTRLIIMKDKHTVIAYYGSNKIALSLHDSAPTSFKEVENFNESYYTNSSSKSVVRFLKIRNGYKTVNEIRQSEGKTNIEFVLNDRFIVNITGLANQTPTRVWSYMELPKLKELYNYR